MDTLKHGKVYNTLPRILQQISDENRALYRTGDTQKHAFFNAEYQKMQKHPQVSSFFFCLFLNLVMKSVSTRLSKAKLKQIIILEKI